MSLMWLIWEPINLNYRGDRPQAVPQGTGKEKQHNKTQKLKREHLFSPPTDPQSSPVGGQPGFRSLLKAASPRAWFQMPGVPLCLSGDIALPEGGSRLPPTGSPPVQSTHRPPGAAPGGSDSPFSTLETTAGQHVLSRHLHVNTPIAVDADPVRNGFHSPERLQEQAPGGEPRSALRSLQPAPRRP